MVKQWFSSLWPLFVYVLSFYIVFLVASVASAFFPYPIAASPVFAYAIAMVVALGVAWLASGSSRLFLARRFGRVSETLRQTERIEGAEGYDEAVKTLRSRIPAHPARDLLIRAHHRLWNLAAFAKWSQYDGVPEPVIARFAEQAAIARDALWQSADRVAVLMREGAEAPGRLDEEVRKLTVFLDGIKQARLAEAELAVLALREKLDEDTQNEIVESGLVALARVTEQLNPAQIAQDST